MLKETPKRYIMTSTVRIALCQLLCGNDKGKNLASAVAAISEAALRGAQIVALPECFNRSVIMVEDTRIRIILYYS